MKCPLSQSHFAVAVVRLRDKFSLGTISHHVKFAVAIACRYFHCDWCDSSKIVFYSSSRLFFLFCSNTDWFRRQSELHVSSKTSASWVFAVYNHFGGVFTKLHKLRYVNVLFSVSQSIFLMLFFCSTFAYKNSIMLQRHWKWKMCIDFFCIVFFVYSLICLFAESIFLCRQKNIETKPRNNFKHKIEMQFLPHDNNWAHLQNERSSDNNNSIESGSVWSGNTLSLSLSFYCARTLYH